MAALSERLRAKLPEIAFEAVSIVFAVVLALGVDQWREDRTLRRQAERARLAIIKELRTNRDELAGCIARNENWYADIAAVLRKPGVPTDMRPSMSWAVLSSAALQTAQGTQASQFFDYDWLIQVAQVYEAQALFANAQAEFFTESGLAFMSETRREALQVHHDRLGYLVKLGQQIMFVYDLTLAGKKLPARPVHSRTPLAAPAPPP